MKRMKNGTVGMEFSAATKGKGYTMRANISADCIRALKRWNKDSAVAICNAIRRNDCKAVIRELENAKHRNRKIRELSEHHDKIVYDASGKVIYMWDHKEKCMYRIED
mgnify:CR=1 FL=1|jgi:hypothetical protein